MPFKLHYTLKLKVKEESEADKETWRGGEKEGVGLPKQGRCSCVMKVNCWCQSDP